jgi:TetR/AcrR family transcriptional repressor of mexJK operon
MQQSVARTVVAMAEPVPSKREAILAAGTRVFLDQGYGAASMDAIARAAGVSKQTIYAYFGGKAALFEATVLERSDRLLEPVPTETDSLDSPEMALRAIAHRFLELILSPETVARFRVIVAESGRFPELAEAFYRSGPERVGARLSGYLAELHRQGILRVEDPPSASIHFFGMVRGDLFLRQLLGLGEPPRGGELDRIVDSAVRAFLSAYAPD